MKQEFYENFTDLLLLNGFKSNKEEDIFFKTENGIFYIIFPFIYNENSLEIEGKTNFCKKFLTENVHKLNINKTVFLKLFITDKFEEKVFKNITDDFDINSEVLFLDWAFDVNKGEVFVRKGHIKKVLNLDEIIKTSLLEKSVLKEYEKNIQAKKYKISSKKAIVTFSLIFSNIIIYIYFNLLNKDDFTYTILKFANSYYGLKVGEYYRLFTSMFLHVNFEHILSNCISLYIFGNITEKLIGRKLFITCYILGGVIASLISSIFNKNGISLGASGAIFAIEGAFVGFYLMERKNLRSLNLYQIVLIAVLGIFISYMSFENVDNFGHLGGFLAGNLLIFILYKTKKLLKNK